MKETTTNEPHKKFPMQFNHDDCIEIAQCPYCDCSYDDDNPNETDPIAIWSCFAPKSHICPLCNKQLEDISLFSE